MATFIYWNNTTSGSITPSGTLGNTHYVLGPPQDPTGYNGHAQGRYLLTTGTTYKWVLDEPVDVNTASRTTYAYDVI